MPYNIFFTTDVHKIFVSVLLLHFIGNIDVAHFEFEKKQLINIQLQSTACDGNNLFVAFFLVWISIQSALFRKKSHRQ